MMQLDASFDDALSPSTTALDSLLILGRDIDACYPNATPMIKETLQQAFSLLAYDLDDEGGAKVRNLLNVEARVEVADAFSHAVLVGQSMPSRPALESLYRETVMTLRQMGEWGLGSASLINTRDHLNSD